MLANLLANLNWIIGAAVYGLALSVGFSPMLKSKNEGGNIFALVAICVFTIVYLILVLAKCSGSFSMYVIPVGIITFVIGLKITGLRGGSEKKLKKKKGGKSWFDKWFEPEGKTTSATAMTNFDHLLIEAKEDE